MKPIKVKDIEKRLDITATTCLEVRKKLNIGKFVTEENYKRIERFVNDVRSTQGNITLTTINDFLDYHKLEDYKE